MNSPSPTCSGKWCVSLCCVVRLYYVPVFLFHTDGLCYFLVPSHILTCSTDSLQRHRDRIKLVKFKLPERVHTRLYEMEFSNNANFIFLKYKLTMKQFLLCTASQSRIPGYNEAIFITFPNSAKQRL